MSRQYKQSADVPNSVLADRLSDLATVVSNQRDRMDSEFTMRIPAEVDRDPDLVMSEAARRLKHDGVSKTTLADMLLPYAIGDAEDGGEDYEEYAARLRDFVSFGQIADALNDVADRMCEIKSQHDAKVAH